MWYEANNHVWDDVAEGPGLVLRHGLEKVELVVVKYLAAVGLWDTRVGFFEGKIVRMWETVTQKMDAVSLG